MNDAALSVVAHRDRPEDLLVRSRVKEDITRVVASAEVWEDEHADYRYRAIIPREVFATAMADRIRAITYGNFKASVPSNDPQRLEAYHGAYNALVKQYGAYGRPPHDPR